MLNIQSKLPKVGDTIFNEMSTLALQHQAINLGQGFPDYQPPEALLEEVCQAIRRGPNQYAPMAGIPALRAAIASKVQAQHGVTYQADTEITVTSGATEALASSILALVHAGDEVILIDPAYDLYAPVIELAGGVPIRVPLRVPSPENPQFQLDWNAIEAVIRPSSRLLVLNFPHNPTGITLKEADLDALETLLAHSRLLLLSDEAYEHIIFDGRVQYSPVSRPQLAARCVLVSSFGKTFHATGWKVGYCCAPAALMTEIRKVHQYAVYSVSTPVQAGIAAYLQQGAQLDALSGFYQQKRDRLAAGLQQTILRALPSEGTFFLLVDASALGDLPEKTLSLRILHQCGVASIPVSAFYDDPHAPEANHRLLRLCFAKLDATLDAAIERLQTLRIA
ncbi:methionine aminotransferase [Castellaniella caeni]|uniref:methionine aminotransferase n=1 Tax=Castellaniella caeni TaxID=266123 RepID=UPI00082CF188|nr:methionine aminotransferase [Castellaniella caeni]